MSNNILDQELVTSENQPLPVVYASFWSRVGAFLIDFVVLLPLYIISMLNVFNAKIFAVNIILSLMIFLYRPVMEWQYRATVGKLALGLWATNEAYGRMSFGQALARSVFYGLMFLISIYTSYLLFSHPDFPYTDTFIGIGQLQQDAPQALNTIPTVLWFISVIWVALDSRNQALHDKLARTFVIEKPRGRGA